MSISNDVNADLLNKCFELGALHGLRKPHPSDQVSPPETPPPEAPIGNEFPSERPYRVLWIDKIITNAVLFTR